MPPPISEFRPGCKIADASGSFSTLTCFALKRAVAGKLYGVTAGHCIPPGGSAFFGGGFGEGLFVGSLAEHASKLDALCFEIDEDVVRELTERNFRPLGFDADVILVWDPKRIRYKVEAAPRSDEQKRLKEKTMNVRHMGQKSTTTLDPVSGAASRTAPMPGTMVKYGLGGRTNFVGPVAAGDSGGPLIDSKQRYVALVSNGGTAGQSLEGRVVYLSDAFDALGLELGAWHNRARWQMQNSTV
jgi:hypothetical protein